MVGCGFNICSPVVNMNHGLHKKNPALLERFFIALYKTYGGLKGTEFNKYIIK